MNTRLSGPSFFGALFVAFGAFVILLTVVAASAAVLHMVSPKLFANETKAAEVPKQTPPVKEVPVTKEVQVIKDIPATMGKVFTLGVKVRYKATTTVEDATADMDKLCGLVRTSPKVVDIDIEGLKVSSE